MNLLWPPSWTSFADFRERVRTMGVSQWWGLKGQLGQEAVSEGRCPSPGSMADQAECGPGWRCGGAAGARQRPGWDRADVKNAVGWNERGGNVKYRQRHFTLTQLKIWQLTIMMCSKV